MRHIAKPLATLLFASLLPFAAQAQSSSGNIVGNANVGDTILVKGIDTGFNREIKIDRDGKYQVRRVPTGSYQVIRVRADGSVDPAQTLDIHAGTTGRVTEPGKDATKASETLDARMN